MKHSLFFLLALLFCACGTDSTAEAITEVKTISVDVAAAAPDSLLRHAVMFSFKEESYPDGVAMVEAAFRELPEKIDAIHDFEWGTNNSPEGLDKGFTHLFFVTFKSEADREVYLPHPDHQAFVEVLGPHLADVLVLDYWTRD
ncbi:Dabb family protein [Neolewinella agarilytica]|nr:Dabb family protein [Neolewinella agarilytica]